MEQQTLIVTIVFAVVFVVIYIADVFKYYAFRAALRRRRWRPRTRRFGR